LLLHVDLCAVSWVPSDYITFSILWIPTCSLFRNLIVGKKKNYCRVQLASIGFSNNCLSCWCLLQSRPGLCFCKPWADLHWASSFWPQCLLQRWITISSLDLCAIIWSWSHGWPTQACRRLSLHQKIREGTHIHTHQQTSSSKSLKKPIKNVLRTHVSKPLIHFFPSFYYLQISPTTPLRYKQLWRSRTFFTCQFFF